jgi:ABC-type antimicrobial peptide transport system permease subunit
MTLGAQRGRVVRLVMREMLPVILIGIAAVAATGLLCGRYVETQLFGVKAADPAVFLISVGALLIVSMSAAFVPAWRASRIDPIRALRYE